MLKGELATGERVQPCFHPANAVESVRVLPDGGAWTYEKLRSQCLATSAGVEMDSA